MVQKAKNRKGQLFTFDGALALVILIVVFVFLIILWNNYSVDLDERVAFEELNLLASQFTQIVIKTPGVPYDWETNPVSAQVFGLRKELGVLSQRKIDAFLTYDYNLTKEKFNIERFDFSFTIFDEIGQVVSSVGIEPENSSTHSVAVNRIVIIENETRKMLFTIWKK